MATKRGVVVDKGELKKAELTSQGFLRAPAFATRTGVFTYKTPQGIRRELRHPDDVFAPESLATLKGIPVTDDHPNVDDPDVLVVTPANCRKYMVGYTGDDVQTQDRFVVADVIVTDAEAIKAVQDGKTEVSCGYLRDLEEAPGEYEGVAYDFRQRNIVYNHLAIVDRGRAGPEVRIRLDAADAVQVDETTLSEESRMEKVTINGVEYECSPDLKNAIMALQAKGTTPPAAKTDDATTPPPAANAKGDMPGEAAVKTDESNGEPAPTPGAKPAAPAAPGGDDKAKLDAATARCDSLTAENAKLKEQLKSGAPAVDGESVKKAARERMRLERIAARVLTKEELAAVVDADDRAIKVAVIKAEQKGAVLDGKSDAYLDARFDAVADGLDASDGHNDAMGRSMVEARSKAAADAGDGDAEAARKRQMERNANAWQTGAAAKK